MGQVRCLDLQVAEDGEDFGHGHLATHFQNVEETRDVLLDIKLHAKWLKSHVFDPPHVQHVDISGSLELGDALQESVHIVDVVVKDLLGRILYCPQKMPNW